MMIFLIEYDRARGEIVTFKTFDDSERQNAEDSRLELELKLNQLRTAHEVVILEAASEEALRRTHRRYFENLSELVNSPA
jgi:predicted dinucleotide-utilizing enzyme